MQIIQILKEVSSLRKNLTMVSDHKEITLTLWQNDSLNIWRLEFTSSEICLYYESQDYYSVEWITSRKQLDYKIKLKLGYSILYHIFVMPDSNLSE